jgi:type IV pilus assembly protein PilM
MARRVTTLFIRDDAILLLVVEGKRIKQWASLPLEPGLVSQGLVTDEARVADDVTKLFKLTKIGARRVIAGFSGLNSLYRLISLPELPEAILPEAVKQEARRVIPVPLEEVYLLYQRLPASPGETRLFLATFPRNAADVLIRTLRRAGVEPYLMDLAPLALCRALDKPRAIIVNARLDHLDVMVMEDRLPQLIRRLSLPGEVVPLAERLPAITEEVERTVAFYNSSHKEKPLDSAVPMFVCGDPAQAPESWQSLAGRLGSPVSVLPSPLESPEGFDPNEFMVNIGLALKELPLEGANYSLVNFNALPEVYLPKRVRLSSILIPAGLIIGVGILVYMGFQVRDKASYNSVLLSQLTPAESRITEEQKKIGALQEQIKQVEAGVAPVQARAKIFDDKFNELEVGREQTDRELTDIVNLLPGTLELKEVNHEGESVTVKGVAPDEDDIDAIFRYARDLRIKFASVAISSIEVKIDEVNGTISGYNFEFLLSRG